MGELTYLAGGLPQAFQQIIAALRHELELNLISIDRGTTYEGDPGPAWKRPASHSKAAPRRRSRCIADAQNAINAAAYGGPDSDEPDEGEL